MGLTSTVLSFVTWWLYLTIVPRHVAVEASGLFLTTMPQDIKITFTQRLRLQCSFTETPTSTVGNIVGRAVPATSGVQENGHFDTSNAEFISARNAPQTHAFKRVAGITITRNGIPIASLSSSSAAKIVSDIDKVNANISGDLSANIGGQLGNIELVWDFPTDDQIGKYQCSVEAVDDLGNTTTFSSSVAVGKSAVSIDDLLKEVHSLKTAVGEQDLTLSKQRQLIDSQRQLIDLQQASISNERSKSDNLLSKMNVQQNEIDQFKTQLATQQTMISHLQVELKDSVGSKSGVL